MRARRAQLRAETPAIPGRTLLSPEILYKHQVGTLVFVLRIQEPLSIWRYGRSVCGEATQLGDCPHASGRKAEEHNGRIVLGGRFRNEVDALIDYREIRAADGLKYLRLIAA